MKQPQPFLPRHRAIYEILRGRIRSRYWKYGEALPSREALCREFAVSAITIRTALRNLQRDGFVHSIRGRGTFACWKKEQEYYLSAAPTAVRKLEITHLLFAPKPADSYLMNMLADAFMEKNPLVAVKFSEIRPRGAEDPCLKLLSSGNLPQCGEFFWHAAYAELNALYPLEQLPDFEELKQELHPGALYPTKDGSGESHIHALYLFFGVPLFMIFNVDHLEHAGMCVPYKPLSWPQIFRISRALAARKPAGSVFTTAVAAPYSYHGVKPFIELLGQDLFNRNVLLTDQDSYAEIFQTESAPAGLELLEKILPRGRTLLHKCDEHFALGEVGFLPLASSWCLNLLEMMNQEQRYFISPIPPVGENRKYRSFHSGFSVGIFRNGIASNEQLLATWEWIRFLFHRRSQYLLSQDFRLPVRNGVESYLQKANPLLYAMARNMLRNSVPQPDFTGMRRAFACTGRRITAFLQGELSAGGCLDAIREELKYLAR